MPEYAIKYLRPLLDMMLSEYGRPIRVIDIGASYAILSSLLLHDLSLSELVDFYAENGQTKDLSWKYIDAFYKSQQKYS